ncbi:MAG: ribonuclease HII [Gemmatimonadetes bacterium]|nr:ribonuclease HII [Gemmatimonadota bacterium]
MGVAADGRGERELLSLERTLGEQGLHLLAGVDEVGRGPLAGPVVVAAVIMPPGLLLDGVDDSKRLSAGRRQELSERILRAAVAVGAGAASCREIDRLNIRRATALAMGRAVARLRPAPQHLLVDGLPVPELGSGTHTAVVGGDGKVHAIACASIVAKVLRDRLMDRLARRYPAYGWERNKGYGTPEHLAALHRFGLTPHHRRSFQPVGDLFSTL